MYQEYFGLRELPFSISPDPRYLYMSEGHREALAHLLYGLKSSGGFVLLTGEVGAGKTTLCRCLIDKIPQKTKVAFILNPKVSASELLSSMCDELSIDYPKEGSSNKDLVDRIYKFLLSSAEEGYRTVAIIEEAQNLDTEVLEQLRLLTNLETSDAKLMQIILIGQPELLDRLALTELRQFSQRIIARFHLGPLSREDIMPYIRHRLSVAGCDRTLFPESLRKIIFKLSQGIPRLINLICDRALLGAYVQGDDRVTRKVLLRAASETLGKPNVRTKDKRPIGYILLVLIICILSALVVFLYYQRPAPSAVVESTKTTPLRDEDNPVSIMKPGDKGDDIRWLKAKLSIVYGGTVPISKGNAYDRGTLIAVKRFQAQSGITADGIVGPETIAALKKASEDKALPKENP